MKKILFITSKYSASKDTHYLTNDLVEELVNLGHNVTVIGYGDENISRVNNHLTEYVIDVSSSIKILKYILIWPKLLVTLFRVRQSSIKFDQIIMFAPLSTMLPAALMVRFLHATKRTAIIFDIFPIAQAKIKALPTWIEPLLRTVERYCLRGFSEITAMGANNKAYIQNYYQTEKLNCPVKVVHLWSRKSTLVRSPLKSTTDRINIVFGGQVIKGRELESLIALFSKIRERDLDIHFDIFSKGDDFELLKKQYQNTDWLNFKSQLPRDKYINELMTYDIGAIVTDKKSNLPTFPSKILDYTTSGLKVYALVEDECDFNTELSEFTEVVYTNAFDYSEDEISKTIQFLGNSDIESLDSQLKKITALFSVNTAAERLLK